MDTHTFLWFVEGNKQLPQNIISKINNINQSCYISIVSFWEIAIKIQLGKLELDIPFNELFEFAKRNQIEIIEISELHLTGLLNLEPYHKDPFDRLIISQTISEKLTLLSKDNHMDKYKIILEWD
ncbi:type II toxin-antitoxin system VapC family toxin [uncultured Pedobacter sp.]|uniref:type II toxin-antitoxin system VapC family toxin n=1 Tax=uncultured Pedobacter sp. TaxID=246139 RepID=UPI002609C4C4|nr:type II toxin-antitoxin system VapC family toxin [uncultured Pedobacter sp.]